MKKLLTLLIGGLAMLLFFNSACSNLNSGSSNTNPKPKKTPEIVDGRVINETGWKVPLKTDTEKATPIIKKINSTEGKPFKVKTTYFSLNNEVSYTEELFSEGVTRLHGELILSNFEEFSLNDKVYLYSIVSREETTINQRNVNAHNEMLIYQILDNDGDGIFETLIDNDSPVLIPKWAIK